MLRELVTRPISALVALIELPGTVQRSLKQANELMESSRRQLEAMQAQTDHALKQAERMNEMLGRVVKLAEPLEKAQRGGEYVGGRLKRAIFGEEAQGPPQAAGADPVTRRAVEHVERAVEDAEAAAEHAEEAAVEAEDAAKHSEVEAKDAAERLEEARKLARNPGAGPAEGDGGWQPAASRKKAGGGVEVPDSATIRVIPNQPPPGESEPGK